MPRRWPGRPFRCRPPQRAPRSACRSGRGNLRVHLVGGDLDDRLVLGDAVAGRLRHSGACPRRPTRPSGASRSPSRCRLRRPRTAPRPRPRVRLVGGDRQARAVLGAISASTLQTPTVSPSAASSLTTMPLTAADFRIDLVSRYLDEVSSPISSPLFCHSRSSPRRPVAHRSMTTSTIMFTAISGPRPYRVEGGLQANLRAAPHRELPILPPNGPTPPMTATMTPAKRITPRRTASTRGSDVTIQPIPCAQPRTYSRRPYLLRMRSQQGDVDRRVREQVLEARTTGL